MLGEMLEQAALNCPFHKGEPEKLIDLADEAKTNAAKIGSVWSQLHEMGYRADFLSLVQRANFEAQIETIHRPVIRIDQWNQVLDDMSVAFSLMGNNDSRVVKAGRVVKKVQDAFQGGFEKGSNIVLKMQADKYGGDDAKEIREIIGTAAKTGEFDIRSLFDLDEFGYPKLAKFTWVKPFTDILEMMVDSRELPEGKQSKYIENELISKLKNVPLSSDCTNFDGLGAVADRKPVPKEHSLYPYVMELRQHPEHMAALLKRVNEFNFKAMADPEALELFGKEVLLLGHTKDPRVTWKLIDLYKAYEKKEKKIVDEVKKGIDAQFGIIADLTYKEKQKPSDRLIQSRLSGFPEYGKISALKAYVGLALDMTDDKRVESIKNVDAGWNSNAYSRTIMDCYDLLKKSRYERHQQSTVRSPKQIARDQTHGHEDSVVPENGWEIHPERPFSYYDSSVVRSYFLEKAWERWTDNPGDKAEVEKEIGRLRTYYEKLGTKNMDFDFIWTILGETWKEFNIRAPGREMMLRVHQEIYERAINQDMVHAGIECGIEDLGLVDIPINLRRNFQIRNHFPELYERTVVQKAQPYFQFYMKRVEEWMAGAAFQEIFGSILSAQDLRSRAYDVSMDLLSLAVQTGYMGTIAVQPEGDGYSVTFGERDLLSTGFSIPASEEYKPVIDKFMETKKEYDAIMLQNSH